MEDYLDDIIVTGVSQHLETLELVLRRLAEVSLRLKRNKCTFMAGEVIYLGHKIYQHGLHPAADKVEAIKKTIGALKLLWQISSGSVDAFGHTAQVATCKDTVWSWGSAQRQSFMRAKELLLSADVLVHYDPNKRIILQCDASSYGVGAVLSHIMDDGSEHPVGFASRTLNAAERNYSQLDKEAAAIMFVVKKFHKQIYGRRFKIITDHQPLVSLFSDLKQVPTTASPRIQRWAVIL